MSPRTGSRSRWLLPVGAAAVLIGGSAAMAASASADTPTPTAAELLTAVQQPSVNALSGTVTTQGDLGLPSVPSSLADVGPFSLNDDEVSADVWVNGDSQQRISVGAGDNEVSAIRNGDVAWLWSAAENTATRVTADSKTQRSEMPGTPAEIAAQMLAKVEPTSTVTVTDGEAVAGRDVFDLVVSPNDDQTLVDRVVVSVDAQTSVPLGVAVYSTELSSPAFESAFTAVSFATPDSAVFDFTPPLGATVNDKEPQPKADKPDVDAQVVGEGWSSVVVGQMDVTTLASAVASETATADPAMREAAGQALMTFMSLPTVTGDWGNGRVVEGTLFTVVITEDGRYAVGAVPVETVTAALATN